MVIVNNEEKELFILERALSDLRRGMPVILCYEGREKLVWASERIDEFTFNKLRQQNSSSLNSPSLIISENRAQHLSSEHLTNATKIKLESVSYELMLSLIGCVQGLANDINVSSLAYGVCGEYDFQVMQLCKIAELLPTAIVCDDFISDSMYTRVNMDKLHSTLQRRNNTLQEIVRSKLHLSGANNAQIVCYREKFSTVEHYAIIIGDVLNNVHQPIFVRIHSSCYTGDILDSLTCDCGSQLTKTIHEMDSSGGVLIYLQQEGRGIGLVNKLRCYNLQSQGFDTVDANTILGFDDDERSFKIAGSILCKLGIKKVRLMTNNPRKVKSISECGIDIDYRVSHIATVNEMNKKYMQTKVQKLGHMIHDEEFSK